MWFKRLARVASIFLVLVLGIGGCTNARQVVQVRVTPLPAAEDVGDGLGGKPDWRVDLWAGGRWQRQSTFDDQDIGEGLTWELRRPVPRGEVELIRLVEDDTAGDDVLEEVRCDGDEVVGPEYRYALTSEIRLVGGLLWYMTHLPGLLLVLLLFVTLVLSIFRPWGLLDFATTAMED